jgi:hypothetical protein
MTLAVFMRWFTWALVVLLACATWYYHNPNVEDSGAPRPRLKSNRTPDQQRTAGSTQVRPPHPVLKNEPPPPTFTDILQLPNRKKMNKQHTSGVHKDKAGPVDQDFQARFDDIAVVVIGGVGRAELLNAAYSSWTSVFKNRIFVTDAPPGKHEGPPGMASILRNVFEGFASEEDAFRTHSHPEHPFRAFVDDPEKFKVTNHYRKNMTLIEKEIYSNKHNIGWHLGQVKYLLGLDLVLETFPDAKWYILADSDTFIFPERTVAGLRLDARLQTPPVAIGNVYGAANSPLIEKKFTTFLGGAGIIINNAGMLKMDLKVCINMQVTHLGWSTAPADWRVGLCLDKYHVKKDTEKYMYQSNEQLNCLPHAPVKECTWGGRYGRTMSDCPITLHYQTPERMQELFDERLTKDKGGVCLPAVSWQQFTADCDCYTYTEAIVKGHDVIERLDKLSFGKDPTWGELIDVYIAEIVAGRQTELDLKLKPTITSQDVRKHAEEQYRVMLFTKRKDLALLFDTISSFFATEQSTTQLYKKDPQKFRAKIIEQFAIAASHLKKQHGIREWLTKHPQ